MFDAIVVNSTLQEFLAPVTALVDECKIHLTEEGLEIRAVDPANVGMVHATLGESAFESYEADGGVLGVNLSDLVDPLKLGETGDLVWLGLNQTTRKLEVTVHNTEYTLATIDPDSIRQEPDISDLDLPAEVVCEGGDFEHAVKAADLVGDRIIFGADIETRVFYAKGYGDTNDVRHEFDEDDVIDLEVAEAQSIYSLDFVTDMAKVIDDGAECRLRVGEEYPFDLRFDVAEGHGAVQYQLAPRIAGDE